MNSRKSLSTGSVIAAIAVFVLPACHLNGYNHVRDLKLGFERPGVSLELVQTVNAAPTLYKIEIHSARSTVFFCDLNQLRGLVTIKSPGDALKYVRLLTSYATGVVHDLSDGEIVTTAEYPGVPAFGLPISPYYKSDGGPGNDLHLGILTNDWFRKCGLSPPTVRANGSGFVVERWLKGGACKDSYAVKVSETVGTDGGYERIVLVPHLRLPLAIQWWSIPLM